MAASASTGRGSNESRMPSCRCFEQTVQISRVRALSRRADRPDTHRGETSVLLVPPHRVLCAFDGQHPKLSGEITLSQAGHGRVWDGIGWDGWMDGRSLLLLSRFEAKKIHGTWPTRRDVDRYVPKRSFQVHAHRYVSIRGALYRIRYVPAAGVAVTEFGQALTWAPPLLPGPCPEVALHRTKSHPTPGALVSKADPPPPLPSSTVLPCPSFC